MIALRLAVLVLALCCLYMCVEDASAARLPREVAQDKPASVMDDLNKAINQVKDKIKETFPDLNAETITKTIGDIKKTVEDAVGNFNKPSS